MAQVYVQGRAQLFEIRSELIQTSWKGFSVFASLLFSFLVQSHFISFDRISFCSALSSFLCVKKLIED